MLNFLLGLFVGTNFAIVLLAIFWASKERK